MACMQQNLSMMFQKLKKYQVWTMGNYSVLSLKLFLLRKISVINGGHADKLQLDKKFSAFMVEDRPGEQFLTLRGRSTIDENIKIEATMFDGYGTVSPKLRDEDTELNPQLHISLLVDISKGEGSDMLEFVCSAWPDRLVIDKLYVLALDGKLSRPYIGPDFR